jgi:arginine decarboxylase
MGGWTIRDSAACYGISNWGSDYFSVGENGHVQVHPEGSDGARIDMLDLVQGIRTRGLHTPLLLRFSDILASRIREIDACFRRAIADYDYRGGYRGVYPIKVNQQRHVVEEIVAFGESVDLGLEVGSKPELLVALALLENPDALLICNGYKDRAYMETALLAQRLGRHPVIVLDRPTELELLIKVAHELGIRPHIGVRARLAARGEGKWVESSGDRSKFGLSAAEIVRAVGRLRAEDMLECLELLHFHIGSQITAIRAHKDALREASRIFVGLFELGATPSIIDVGGGLSVDYDGSQTDFHSSMNYSAQEYASDVVAAIREACEDRGVPHPDIVTESGRALTSHASVLVFDVLGVDEAATTPRPATSTAGEHRIIQELAEVLEHIGTANALESYHDALQLKEEALSLFALGYVDLSVRARMEELYWSCSQRILEEVQRMEYVPEDLQGLERTLADTYYGNFSVFQSLPDTWTMDQLFPMMPIHRLDEQPTRRGTFADLTCDSDGKVDQFIDLHDVRKVLELHAPDGRPYFVGVFLVGAYQETLGELHNLFGDTDAVHVHLDGDGSYSVEHVVEGDTVEEVLSYVQYDRRDLAERVRRATERAHRRGDITLEELRLLRRRYEQGLSGYTYLDQGD